VQIARLLHLSSRGAAPKGCTCGHGEQAHEHYRRGTDCALCSCPRFRAGTFSRGRDERGNRSEQASAA